LAVTGTTVVLPALAVKLFGNVYGCSPPNVACPDVVGRRFEAYSPALPMLELSMLLPHACSALKFELNGAA
jgi:hypothetical protein